MSTTDTAETLYNSLSNQWNYTRSKLPFIKLATESGNVYVINLNQIVCINTRSRLIVLTNGDTLIPTSESMSRLLTALDCE